MYIKLLRCIDCNEIIVLTPFDDAPEYEYDSENDNVIVIKRNDRQKEEKRHKGHSLEKLRIIEGTFVSRCTEGNTNKEFFFEATNGIDGFVIKRSRNDINQPMHYELIKGWIHVKDFDIVNHSGKIC